MVAILNTEGFDINERQLAKIRKQNGLWMRDFRKTQSHPATENVGGGRDGDAQENVVTAPKHKRSRELQEDGDGVPAEVIAKRQERQVRLMNESEERLRSRTRRRRTRGWAGLPPDKGMGPRFPSELTLGESIVELDLDKEQYRAVRQNFEQICLAHSVVKKTICGPEKWNNVKNELINGFPQLQTMFWNSESTSVNQTQKPMALDVICMDVTKRLRTSGQHVTIADAKNTLGLTPEEGREVRAAFGTILKADFFTGKLESTKEHWEELKDRWVKESTRLRMAISLGQADPAYTSKMKAIESIARDVQKRNRDYQTKRVFPRDGSERAPRLEPGDNGTAPSTTKSFKAPKSARATAIAGDARAPQSSQAGATPQQHINHESNSSVLEGPSNRAEPMSTLASQALAQGVPSQAPLKDYSGMQIDPSLLEAAALPIQQHHQQQQDFTNDHAIFTQLQQATSALQQQSRHQSQSIYFRLSPMSAQRFPAAPKIWLDTLPVGNRNVGYIRSLALTKTALDCIASVKRIEGLAGYEGANKWEIGEDDELEAYLHHVGTGKATFVLEME